MGDHNGSAVRVGAAASMPSRPLEHFLGSLEGLVGQQRATILRLLEVPATCGQIAKALFLAPGGVTHHLRNLEAAGLIRRTRRGRNVLVERTATGRAVLALYQVEPRPPR